MANKKLSISQLKKDAKKGTICAKIEFWKAKPLEELPERLRGTRLITRSNTVAIFFLNADGEESELHLPKAPLVDYTEEELSIFYPGYREPNEDEKEALSEWKAITETKEYRKQMETDCLTDGSSTYWKEVAFFNKKGMEYLMGFHEERGLYLDHNRKNAGEPCFIRDASIRGELEIKYALSKYNA